jgi:glycosyltransferase involved in cell wall biosynthesis
MDEYPAFALVAPFHNEARHLPSLIQTLRAQRRRNFRVVFVDNGSRDGSADVVRDCAEVASGRWALIDEPEIGKFYAVRTAVAYCVDRLGAQYVGTIDADVQFLDPHWSATVNAVLDGAAGSFGYVFGPYDYTPFESLPTFQSAYNAYSRVLRWLQERIGGFAHGANGVFAADILSRYFESAEATIMIDVRPSLLAVFEGREARFNPRQVVVSGRRMIVNRENFEDWCFRPSSYYRRKDLNNPTKLDLDAPRPVQDLADQDVPRFFSRRAIKLICRDLFPLVLMDRTGRFERAFETALGGLGADLAGLRARYGRRETIFGEALEGLIAELEDHDELRRPAKGLAAMMTGVYETTLCGRSITSSSPISI